MDTLTQKGLEHIEKNKGSLERYARILVEKARNQNEYDFWQEFDVGRQGTPVKASKPENCVNVNVWLPDDLNDVQENWKATAYPLERVDEKYGGGIQTNCQDFVELF